MNISKSGKKLSQMVASAPPEEPEGETNYGKSYRKSHNSRDSGVMAAPPSEPDDEGETKTKIKTDGTEITTTTKSISIADEIVKLAKLRDQGIITEAEFKRLKEKLIGS